MPTGRFAPVAEFVMLLLLLFLFEKPQLGAQGPPAPLAWPAIERDARPWTRWWWLGSAVTPATLSAELRQLREAGFGGVEITAIYGVRGAESLSVPYLSPKWVELLRHTIGEAQRLGMAVDLPQGSGWRMGGPFVPASDVNASLRVTFDSVRGGYIAEIRPSGDNVKRAAPGNEGPAIDVFSRAATERYLRDIARRLTVSRGALRSYFHDSFEYTGTGSADLFDTFRRNRGYDLNNELAALAGQGKPDHVARVKSDYRQTLDEMLLENFVRPIAAWSHARGSLIREQAHGSPGNLLDLYAATDIPETEIYGPIGGADADPLINKFASSAAHVAGRRLASAESFTWMSEHFSGTLDEVKHSADLLFTAGINHLVYHGTAYSPPDVPWPGWQFYASMEFNPRNPWWRDLPTLNAYVARVQSVLQGGQPSSDVLLYWPIWDNWHDASGLRMDFPVHRPSWFHSKPIGEVAKSLWTAGYSFDYVSDRQLTADISVVDGRLRSRGGEYRLIMVPRTEHMPVATLERLLTLARAGAMVLFVGQLPRDVPGLAHLDDHRTRLATALGRINLPAADAGGVQRAALGRGQVLVASTARAGLDAIGVHRELLADIPGVSVIRRRRPNGYDYFVANQGPVSIFGWVSIAARAAAVAIMDPLTLRAGLADRRAAPSGDTELRLDLAPGESRILRTFDAPLTAPRWRYEQASGSPIPLNGQWAVRFLAGGPAVPASFTSDSAVAWTGRGDAEADRFAGTARYAVRFHAPATAADYVLDLGRVAESARVRVNGKELGTLVARPFRIHTGPLRTRDNVLEIDVTNLSANRVRDLDRRGVQWKIFRDINFVGLDYRPFDASNWPVRRSGLVGPVTLMSTRK